MKVLSNFLLPTSYLVWSLANGRFLPILLDEKKRRDGRSFGGNRGEKVVGASSKDALLRIPLH